MSFQMAEENTILFIDLDGTVMTNPFWTVVFPTLSDELSQKTGKNPDTIIKELIDENKRRLEQSVGSYAMDWDDIAATVANNCGVKLVSSVIDLVRQHSGPPYTSILDDAALVLKSLAQQKPRKVIATSMGLSKYQ